MLVRFGVRLPPFKARLLDMLADVTRGRGGITMDSLCVVFAPGVDRARARRRIATHVHQLNEWLVETDVWVRSRSNRHDGGTYWLEVEGRKYGKA